MLSWAAGGSLHHFTGIFKIYTLMTGEINQRLFKKTTIFCSVEIMLVRKLKRGDRYRIAMGPRALTASSGLAPWSMAVDRTSAA